MMEFLVCRQHTPSIGKSLRLSGDLDATALAPVRSPAQSGVVQQERLLGDDELSQRGCHDCAAMAMRGPAITLRHHMDHG